MKQCTTLLSNLINQSSQKGISSMESAFIDFEQKIIKQKAQRKEDKRPKRNKHTSNRLDSALKYRSTLVPIQMFNVCPIIYKGQILTAEDQVIYKFEKTNPYGSKLDQARSAWQYNILQARLQEEEGKEPEAEEEKQIITQKETLLIFQELCQYRKNQIQKLRTLTTDTISQIVLIKDAISVVLGQQKGFNITHFNLLLSQSIFEARKSVSIDHRSTRSQVGIFEGELLTLLTKAYHKELKESQKVSFNILLTINFIDRKKDSSTKQKNLKMLKDALKFARENGNCAISELNFCKGKNGEYQGRIIPTYSKKKLSQMKLIDKFDRILREHQLESTYDVLKSGSLLRLKPEDEEQQDTSKMKDVASTGNSVFSALSSSLLQTVNKVVKLKKKESEDQEKTRITVNLGCPPWLPSEKYRQIKLIEEKYVYSFKGFTNLLQLQLDKWKSFFIEQDVDLALENSLLVKYKPAELLLVLSILRPEILGEAIQVLLLKSLGNELTGQDESVLYHHAMQENFNRPSLLLSHPQDPDMLHQLMDFAEEYDIEFAVIDFTKVPYELQFKVLIEASRRASWIIVEGLHNLNSQDFTHFVKTILFQVSISDITKQDLKILVAISENTLEQFNQPVMDHLIQNSFLIQASSVVSLKAVMSEIRKQELNKISFKVKQARIQAQMDPQEDEDLDSYTQKLMGTQWKKFRLDLYGCTLERLTSNASSIKSIGQDSNQLNPVELYEQNQEYEQSLVFRLESIFAIVVSQVIHSDSQRIFNLQETMKQVRLTFMLCYFINKDQGFTKDFLFQWMNFYLSSQGEGNVSRLVKKYSKLLFKEIGTAGLQSNWNKILEDDANSIQTHVSKEYFYFLSEGFNSDQSLLKAIDLMPLQDPQSLRGLTPTTFIHAKFQEGKLLFNYLDQSLASSEKKDEHLSAMSNTIKERVSSFININVSDVDRQRIEDYGSIHSGKIKKLIKDLSICQDKTQLEVIITNIEQQPKSLPTSPLPSPMPKEGLEITLDKDSQENIEDQLNEDDITQKFYFSFKQQISYEEKKLDQILTKRNLQAASIKDCLAPFKVQAQNENPIRSTTNQCQLNDKTRFLAKQVQRLKIRIERFQIQVPSMSIVLPDHLVGADAWYDTEDEMEKEDLSRINSKKSKDLSGDGQSDESSLNLKNHKSSTNQNNFLSPTMKMMPQRRSNPGLINEPIQQFLMVPTLPPRQLKISHNSMFQQQALAVLIY